MPWLEIAVMAAMVIGLLGTVVPIWPGLAVVWAAALVYGLIDGFGALGAAVFGLMTLLAVAGTLAKIVLPARGGARAGASMRTLGIAAVAGVVGAVVLPAFGLPIGALVGVWIGELVQVGDPTKAWHRTLAVLRGLGLGILVELGLGTLMVALWLVWAIAG